VSAVLRIGNLGFAVREKSLLHAISAELPAGSMTAVIGPNGAGKSTLLKALSATLHGWSGSILLDDKDVRRWSKPELACRMAYLPQFRPVSVPLPVEDIVAMGRFPHLGAWRPLRKNDREAIEQAMERMEIVHLRGRDATTLSGGELQRTYLARCLAQGSPLLLLDEPLTGLDIGHQLALLSILEDLAAEGKTILWSVHDLRLAAEHAREAWLLDQGALTRHGPIDEVLASPEAQTAFGVVMSRSDDGSWRFGRG
jgi:iron complex transport system ATP-binding protein